MSPSEIRIAILTAERDAALARFRENADMKHFVELWEQDQIDYGTAIKRAEKAEAERDAALARERELVKTILAELCVEDDSEWRAMGWIPSKYIAQAIVDKYDEDGNWVGKVEG